MHNLYIPCDKSVWSRLTGRFAQLLRYRLGRSRVRISVKSDAVSTVATFLRSCDAQALSRGDEPRHSLHANEDLILVGFLFAFTL